MAGAAVACIHALLQAFGESLAQTVDIVGPVRTLEDDIGALNPLVLGLLPRQAHWLLLPQEVPEPRDGGLVGQQVGHVWSLRSGTLPPETAEARSTQSFVVRTNSRWMTAAQKANANFMKKCGASDGGRGQDKTLEQHAP